MSAYAEYKNGQITDAEYNAICRREYLESLEDDCEKEVLIEYDIDEF